jgi:hypothetical protein
VKPKPNEKVLTFGDFIQGVYSAYGKRNGTSIARLAVNSRVLGFRGHQRFFIWEK